LESTLTHHVWTNCAQLRAGLISYARSAGGGRRHVLTELLREHDVVELAREQPLLLTEELICMRSVMAVAVAAAMAARGPARGGALRRPARTVCSAAATQTDPARRAGSAPSEREERAARSREQRCGASAMAGRRGTRRPSRRPSVSCNASKSCTQSMRRAADDLAHALRTLAGRALCGEAIGHGQTQGRLQKQKGRPTWGHAQ